jgi:hypothetical protein
MNRLEIVVSINLESPVLCLTQISEDIIAAGTQASEIFILKISQNNQSYGIDPIQYVNHL